MRMTPGLHGTILGAVRAHVARCPDATAFVFRGDAGNDVSLTYGALDRAARRTAAWLRLHVPAGERVVLIYPSGLDYIIALLGCVYARVIAVPAYPPTTHTWSTFRAIVADAGAKAALSCTALIRKHGRLARSSTELTAFTWLNTDAMPAGFEDAAIEPEIDGETIAYLQYTSGSTGTPKGVIVTHASLAHNVAFLATRYAATREDVQVSWLPPYHDLGLVAGIFAPLFVGFPTVLMSPVSFTQRPLRWLDTMSAYKGTVSGGPNFAYDLCVSRTTEFERAALDLTQWRLAFIGAEPVRPQTIERFAAAFAQAGFRRSIFSPGYGLAEATLLVSGRTAAGEPAIASFQDSALRDDRVVEADADGGDVRRLVGCGRSPDDQHTTIVDPDTGTVCQPGQIGEIWVSGPSVAKGYWGQADETVRTFSARATTRDGRAIGPFLRTGDLGFVHGEELFVAGRLKDLIIIRGRNYHPEDIEQTIAQARLPLDQFEAVAFAAEAGGEERLALAIELNRRVKPAVMLAVAPLLRQTVAERYGLDLHAVVLVRQGTLPRTTSGKIRRHATALAFAGGSLDPMSEWIAREERQVRVEPSPRAVSAAAIEEWLASRVAMEAGLDAGVVDVRAPLSTYGFDSVSVVAISGEIGAWLGRDVPPTLAYEHPSIREIANYLSGAREVSSDARMSDAKGCEPIAITGIGLRFPGASAPHTFWDLLRRGDDAVAEMPRERHGAADFFSADAANPGSRSRHGGFLADIELFDAEFFQISPREAMCLDPQQRMLLEVALEALEDAGESPQRLGGTRTGVFVGISSSEYGALHLRNTEHADAYLSAGNALSIAANRISYVWDFRGPSLAVDTACSSSLVAVHLACRSLWSGESTLALVGGSNLILSPAVTLSFSRAGATSVDGRCKPFDAGADGIVRSEGVAIVVLKPLSQAIAAGDGIYAVIRGTAVNQDGRTNGLVAPNPRAQEDVLREAYRVAGISPAEVDYIEAHGTGTLLGDPIEAKALGAVVTPGRPPGRPCAIGSVKGNIGHAEAAAGMAGLVKVALALRHRQIPPSINFQQPNPYIAFDELAIRVPHALEPWPDGTATVAGVSSFGFGGTNAHVVLQAAPDRADRPRDSPQNGRPLLLPVSARSENALRHLAESFRDLVAAPDCRVEEVCGAASLRRGHHDHRLAIVASSAEQAVERFEAYLERQSQAGVYSGSLVAGRPRKVVFVFSGYGGQWWAMGRKLLAHEPVFRASLEECDAVFREWRNGSLMDEFGRSRRDSRLGGRHVEVTQTALFALQVALSRVWQSFGIDADAVVGHSGGEAAAAYVAGVLTLREAAQVCARRSRLLQDGIDSGADAGHMMAAQLSIAEARALAADHAGRVFIAVHNGPNAVVLAGETAALEEIAQDLERRGAFCRILATPGAGHCPQVDGIAQTLVEALDRFSPQAERVAIFSTVTGTRARGADFDHAYWGRNLRQPVLFADAVDALRREGYDLFLELNAHPIVAVPIVDSFAAHDRPVTVLPSLRQREDDRAVMMKSLGALYAIGRDVRWAALYGEQTPHIDLPRYPWQRAPYWSDLDPPADAPPRHASRSVSMHPLLGRRLTSSQRSSEHFWETEIDVRRVPYLEEHRIAGAIVFPGTGYLEMALSAARELMGNGAYVISNVAFRKALMLAADQPLTVQTVLARRETGQASFTISSRSPGTTADPWTLHATGDIALDPTAAAAAAAAAQNGVEPIAGPSFYEAVGACGLHYGPTFQGVKDLYVGDGVATAVVHAPDVVTAATGLYGWHPALLDACLHVLYADLIGTAERGLFGLPTGLDAIRIHAQPTPRMRARGRVVRGPQPGTMTADVHITDEDGHALAEIRGYTLTELTDARQLALGDPARWLYEVDWRLAPRARGESSDGPVARATWLILEDASGVGAAVAHELAARGIRCVRITTGPAPAAFGPLQFQVDPQLVDQLRDPFDAACELGDFPCKVIMHLWNLDLPEPAGDESEVWRTSYDLGCASLAFITQELLRRPTSGQPRVWVVTRGAQRVAARGGSVVNVAQAPAWGFARSLAQEWPAHWGGLVDLDPAATSHEATALVDEIIGSDGEDQIAFGAERHVARLARVRDDSEKARSYGWRADGTYLVTGGLGRIGPSLLRWMVAEGARHLLLIGRTPLPPRARWRGIGSSDPAFRHVQIVRELESLGASVHLASADVADRDALAACLDAFVREGRPPIRGVIHAAGFGDAHAIQNMDREALAAVLRPKVLGAWWLHELLVDEPIDMFVLFSSFMAVISTPLFSHYAAANAFLDALAAHRRSEGRAALSVNWGTWADPAMQTRLLQAAGIDQFAPHQALGSLRNLLGGDATQVSFARVDWSAWEDLYPGMMKMPMLSDIVRELAEHARSNPARGHDAAGDTGAARRRLDLDNLIESDRRAAVEHYLSSQLAGVLGRDPRTVDFRQPLNRIGIDSLTALEFKNRVEAELRITIPVARLMLGPSLAELTAMIVEQTRRATPAEDSAEPRGGAPGGIAAGPALAALSAVGPRAEEMSDAVAAVAAVTFEEGAV